MSALEAPLSSEPGFGDGLTFHLLLHLLPLLAGQQEVKMLSGDIFTEGVLLDTVIYRNLRRQIQLWISFSIRINMKKRESIQERNLL